MCADTLSPSSLGVVWGGGVVQVTLCAMKKLAARSFFMHTVLRNPGSHSLNPLCSAGAKKYLMYEQHLGLTWRRSLKGSLGVPMCRTEGS